MSAAVAPGGPVAAEAPPVVPDAPTGDVVTDARAEARKVLFEGGEEPAAAPAAPKTPEAPKPEPTETDLSRGFSRLSAQEKRLKERQREFLAEQESFKKQREEYEARTKFDNDPIAFLEKQGWSKDKIVEWIKGDGKVDPEILYKQLAEQSKKQIDDLRAEREQERRELESQRQQRRKDETEYQIGEKSLKLTREDPELGDLKRLAEKNPGKFEPFIKRRVGEIMRQVWEKTYDPQTRQGTLVDERDALVYLQSELAELQLGPAQGPAVQSAKPGAVEPRPITNQASSQRVVQPVKYDESDPQARRDRARKILEGELDPDEE